MKETRLFLTQDQIKALLDGRKTQHRIPMKPQPIWEETPELCDDNVWRGRFRFAVDMDSAYNEPFSCGPDYDDIDVCEINNIFNIGDRLWCPETWRLYNWHEGEPLCVEFKDGKYEAADKTETLTFEQEWRMEEWEQDQWRMISDELIEKAIQPDEYGYYSWDESPLDWHSPVTMPRWAARILLEIVDVRVERLQEITYPDIVAEGTPGPGVIPINTAMMITGTDNMEDCTKELMRSMFAGQWDFINAKKGHPWDSNPWVWVIEFKVLEPKG